MSTLEKVAEITEQAKKAHNEIDQRVKEALRKILFDATDSDNSSPVKLESFGEPRALDALSASFVNDVASVLDASATNGHRAKRGPYKKKRRKVNYVFTAARAEAMAKARKKLKWKRQRGFVTRKKNAK